MLQVTQTHRQTNSKYNAREASQTCSSPSFCKKTNVMVCDEMEKRDEREMEGKKGVKEIQKRARYVQWKNSSVHRTDQYGA